MKNLNIILDNSLERKIFSEYNKFILLIHKLLEYIIATMEYGYIKIKI